MSRIIALITLLFISVSQPAPAAGLSPEEATRFVDGFLRAWESGDLQKILPFYASDASYADPNVPDGIQGEAALRPFLTQLISVHRGWKFQSRAVYPTEKGLVLQYTATLPFQGKIIENFRGVDILEIEEGRIRKQEGYFDLSVFRSGGEPRG